MKQLYLLIYVLISKIGAEKLNECSECGDPLTSIQVWTDNSTVWRRETFSTECSTTTYLTCTRTEHLGGDLYVMLFKASPDVIGINPFFVNKTLSYNIKTKLVCKHGRWLHEDFNIPISHALCDQFINPSFTKAPVLKKTEETTTVEIVTDSFVTEQPESETTTPPQPETTTQLEIKTTPQAEPETTIQPEENPVSQEEKIEMLQSAIDLLLGTNVGMKSMLKKAIPLSSPALSNIKSDAVLEEVAPPIVPTTAASSSKPATSSSPIPKVAQSFVTMSDRRESLEDRPFPQAILDETLAPGYEEPTVPTTTSETISLTSGSSFILFNGSTGAPVLNRKSKVVVRKVKGEQPTRKAGRNAQKRVHIQQRKRPERKRQFRKSSGAVKRGIHKIHL